jgi:hypothetical protein
LANYHLYFFNGQDITGLIAFDAYGDTEARLRVAKEADGRGMELWRDGERVAVYSAEPAFRAVGFAGAAYG